MRTVQQIEIRIARIPPGQVINAKEGVDYPFSSAVMEQSVRFLT